MSHARWDSAQAYRRSMAGDHPADDHDPVGAVIAHHGARVAGACSRSISNGAVPTPGRSPLAQRDV